MTEEEKAYCDKLLEDSDFGKIVAFEVLLEIREKQLNQPAPER